jgi:hypothetical protein
VLAMAVPCGFFRALVSLARAAWAMRVGGLAVGV